MTIGEEYGVSDDRTAHAGDLGRRNWIQVKKSLRRVRDKKCSWKHSFVVVFTQPRMNALFRLARVFPSEVKGASLREPRPGRLGGCFATRLAGHGNPACVETWKDEPGARVNLSFGRPFLLTDGRGSHSARIDAPAWLGQGSLDAHSTQGRAPDKRRICAGRFPTCFAGRSRRLCVTSEQ